MPGERVDLIEKKAIEQVVNARKEVDLLVGSVLKLLTASSGKKIDFIDIDSPKKLETVLTNITTRQKELKGATEQVQVAYKEQERTEKALITAIERRKIATEGTNRALIEQRGAVNRTNAELRKQNTVANSLDKTYQKLLSKYTTLNKKAREAGATFGIQSKEFKKASAAALDYRKRLDGIDNTLKNSQRNVGRYNTALQSTGKLFRQVIGALGIASAITTIFAVIRGGLNTIVEFDRQLIAVGKTTNLTKDELKAFGQQAITLGLQLKGISTEGLLKSAEIAGQLGIRGTRNILKFSETIEKLALTSDIAGQESARAFAKFIEVSSDSVENADRLGSVITELGNNFATTESEILKNTTEIQKGIAIYETSAESVIALGAATNALGGQAEASRGALQKTFKVLNEGATQGKNLEKILSLTGQTAEEFKEEFGRDAVSVFNKFVKGLSESSKEGKNLSNTLADLGLNEKRSEAVIGSLAKNYDVLEDALSRANTEYENNIALNTEYNAAAESLSSHIGDLSDAWANMVLSIEDGDGAISKFFKNAVRDVTQFVGVIKILNETEADTALRQYNEALDRGIKLQEKLLNDRKKAAKEDGLSGKSLDVSLTGSAKEDLAAIQAAIEITDKAISDYNNSVDASKKRLKEIAEIIEKNLTTASGANSLGALREEEEILNAKIEGGKEDARQMAFLLGREEVLKRVLGMEEDIVVINKDENERKGKVKAIKGVKVETKGLIDLLKKQLSLVNKLIDASGNDDERKRFIELKAVIEDQIEVETKGTQIKLSDQEEILKGIDEIIKKEKERLENEKVAAEERDRLNEEHLKHLDELIEKLQIVNDFVNVGADLAIAIVERKVVALEYERDAIDDKYEREIEQIDNLTNKENETEIERLAREKRKEVLEKEYRKEQKKIDKEIAKEKTKQAKIDKAAAAISAAIYTAVAVVKALAVGPPQGYVFAAISAALGAIQIATILAQPIPKYKKGKDKSDNYSGWALVNDDTQGGKTVQEYKKDRKGNITAYQGKNIVSHVNRDDIIYKDFDSLIDAHTPEEIMKKAYNASVVTSLDINNNRLDQYQAQKALNRNMRESRFEEKMIRTMKNWKFHHHTDNSQLAETIADLKDANDFRDGLM